MLSRRNFLGALAVAPLVPAVMMQEPPATPLPPPSKTPEKVSWVAAIREEFVKHPTCDGVYVSGGVWRALGVELGIEDDRWHGGSASIDGKAVVCLSPHDGAFGPILPYWDITQPCGGFHRRCHP